jgi:hypothetical protein
MLNNVKSMLLINPVDGMELFVLISHVQPHHQQITQMLYVKVINQVVLLTNQEVDVWHYLQHVKDIKLKEIVNSMLLVHHAIGIQPLTHV